MTIKATRSRRGDITKGVRVMTMKEPRFLTLCNQPANQVAFKVVRSDNEGEEDTPEEVQQEAVVDIPPVRRARVVKRSSVLRIVYPAGTDKSEVESDAKEFGLTGYSITEEENGSILLTRSDLKDIPADVYSVGLGGSKVAIIKRSEVVPASPVDADAPQHLSVVAIELDGSKYPDTESVLAYLARRNVEFVEGNIERREEGTLVKCNDVASDVETRKLTLDEGVLVVVARSEVPCCTFDSPVLQELSNSAYGNWGWGGIDFNQAQADKEYCEDGREAINVLDDVLRNILYYNSLPVSVRKELAVRALAQFSQYIVSMIDALPSLPVTLSTALENQDMSTNQTNDQPVPITREDIAAMIATGIAEAIAADKKKPEAAMCSDAEGSVTPVSATTDTPAEPVAKPEQNIDVVQRSIDSLVTTVQGLSDRLKTFEGLTVVRSDNPGDTVGSPVAQGGKADVFRGVFNRR